MTRFFSLLALCLIPLLSPLSAQDTLRITDADLQADQSYNWTADRVYLIDGEVILESGGQLSIGAGTLILGRPNPTTGDAQSRLVIANGARILAEGTPNEPIVFTSEHAVTNDPAQAQEGGRGYWDGLVVLGDAIIAHWANTRHYTHSGEVTGTEDDRLLFGGGRNEHDSGVLRYVSIRYARNYGLALAGVGSGTTVDFVETIDGLNGGLNLQGGRVFVRHYVAASNFGSDVNVDLSYKGDNQYWYIVKNRERPTELPYPAVRVRATGYEELDPNGTEFEIFNGTFINGLGDRTEPVVRVALEFEDVAYGINQRNLTVNFPHAMGQRRVASGVTAPGVDIMGNSMFNLENGDLDAARPGVAYTPEQFARGEAPGDLAFEPFNNRMDDQALIRRSCTSVPTCTNPLPLAGQIELIGATGVGPGEVEANDYIGAFTTEDWTHPWSQFPHDATPYQLISGAVDYGNAEVCATENAEGTAAGQLLEIATPQGTFYASSAADGHYQAYVPVGTNTLAVVTNPGLFSQCGGPAVVEVEADSNYVQDLLLNTVKSCASPAVSIAAPFLRRCFSSTYVVAYRNEGSQTLLNPVVTVVLDPFLEYLSGDLPPISTTGDTLRFAVDQLPPFGRAQFRIEVAVSCEAELGQEHCTSATIAVDNRCVLPPGPRLLVEGECDGDEVRFEVKNIGDATPGAPVPYVIIEDEVMREQGTVQPAPGLSEDFTFSTSGTLHFSTAAWPDSTTHLRTAKTLNCNGNTNFPTFLFPATDTEDNVALDCQPNIGAFDPNDKMGYPFGISETRSVPERVDMNYRIRFQNTGTDTAFTVVVTDTLSELLDLSSLKMGVASHPMEWTLDPGRVLRATFRNIMLPDSNINEPASHGFLSFAITATGGLAFGDRIENEADIFFDFNDPIRTNTAFHTISELFAGETTSDRLFSPEYPGLLAYPQPARERVTFEVTGDTAREGFYGLYGADGRLRERGRYRDGRFTALTGQFPAGLYVCMLKSADGRTLALQKFLVQ